MVGDLLSMLSTSTGLTWSSVRRIIYSAPRRYKVYTIPKRSGGVRTIAHPARELKLVQRAFLSGVLDDLPVHQAATAYRIGMSLLDNVKPHAGDGPILKIDLKEFFPSIRALDWINYCKQNAVFENPSDIELSALLLFRREKGERVLRLSIGAPTSPALSNILLHDLDEKIWRAVSERYVTYTRYADDMTFSSVRTGLLQGVEAHVTKIIRETAHPKLEINQDKTRFVTSKFHRDVTGLTLALDGRVTVGQLRKRNIRAGVHNAKKGLLGTADLKRLAGHIAFAESIEPGFTQKLRSIHGENAVEIVLAANRTQR